VCLLEIASHLDWDGREAFRCDPDYALFERDFVYTEEQNHEGVQYHSIMERYRARHRPSSQTAAKTRLLQELRRLLKHVENNVARNLKSYDARVWLLLPDTGAHEKNNPARPEVLVLPAFFYGLPLGADAKNIALKTL
jgi:hypothetical protein